MQFSIRCRDTFRVAVVVVFLLSGVAANAQNGEKALGVIGLAAPVQQQAAQLNVVVDQPRRVYEVGDVFEVEVTSKVDGFLYLFYVHTDDSVNVLYPNFYEHSNDVVANKIYAIPGAGAFKITAQPPFGKGTFKAIVTKDPVPMLGANQIPAVEAMLTLDLNEVKFLQQAAAKGAGVRFGAPQAIQQQNVVPVNILADFSVPITTVQRGRFGADKRALRPAGRFVMAVGVGEQTAEEVRDLPACKRDAEEFARLMKSTYGAAEVVLLTNAEATRANVEKRLKELAAKALPDDELVLFWSGHGDRIKDKTGLERDGVEEILVLHDTDLSSDDKKRATSVTDDQLGRWLHDFDHCEVLVIFDTCFSGGQAANEKSIAKPGAGDPSNFAKRVRSDVILTGPDDAWEGEFDAFTKDITERQAMVLSSSKASEESYVRRENDHSVVTYYLLKYMRDNAGKRFRPEVMFEAVEKQSHDYLIKTWGFDQGPVLIGKQKSGIEF